MNVTVRAALRFRHRAALERGIEAFDQHAYPEFFQSELWTVDGLYAFCERTFEIEVDCHYQEAFLAMAREAVEGAIDLQESDRPHDFTRIFKAPRPVNRWAPMSLDARYTPDKPGEQAAGFREQWAADIEKSRAAAAAKAAKEAAKKPSKPAFQPIVIELPDDASAVIVLRDGSLAIAARDRVIFASAAGELRGSISASVREYDGFNGISGLAELGDGRVVAFQEHTNDLRFVSCDPLAVEAWSAPGGFRAACIQGAVATLSGVLAWNSRSLFEIVLSGGEMREHTPFGEDDYLRGAIPWRDGLLAWTSSVTVAIDAGGRERFRIAGSEPRLLPGDELLLLRSTALAVADVSGRELRSFETGSIGWQRDGGVHHRFVVDDHDVVVATSFPHRLARWDARTGERTWTTTEKILACSPSAAVAVGKTLVATYAAPPFVRDKETHLLIVDHATGAEVARLDLGAPVLGVVPLGEASLAAWVEGRTPGKKVVVYRDLRHKPKAETLSGHQGRVLGLLQTASGDLVSWAADKTVRIWKRPSAG